MREGLSSVKVLHCPCWEAYECKDWLRDGLGGHNMPFQTGTSLKCFMCLRLKAHWGCMFSSAPLIKGKDKTNLGMVTQSEADRQQKCKLHLYLGGKCT